VKDQKGLPQHGGSVAGPLFVLIRPEELSAPVEHRVHGTNPPQENGGQASQYIAQARLNRAQKLRSHNGDRIGKHGDPIVQHAVAAFDIPRSRSMFLAEDDDLMSHACEGFGFLDHPAVIGAGVGQEHGDAQGTRGSWQPPVLERFGDILKR